MSYEPTNWKSGDTVTSAKLNKIEQGIANAGGGGGALIVTNTDGTLDKTWQEIHDAAPLVWGVSRGYLYSPMLAVAEFDGEYIVSFFAPTEQGNVEFIDYVASSADGYPVHQQ